MNIRRSALPVRQPTIATVVHTFERIMSTLFARLRIAIPAHEGRNAYHVRVDGTIDLHFFPDGDGNINVVGNAIHLPDAIAPDCLLRLLRLNTFSPLDPNLSVGVDRGHVQVWARQPMNQLEGSKALRLVKLMLNAIGHVNAIVTNSDCQSKTGRPGSSQHQVATSGE